jgi:hypothetical protein
MARQLSKCLIYALFAVFSARAQNNVTANVAATGPTLTDDAKREIVNAIEDEIYDYGLEARFRSIGKAVGGGEFEIPLFVTSDSQNSSYYIIYRLMPYGEIYRLITMGDDGLARLFRNPRSGFPPDAPATQTVYYDDEHICQLKHSAVKLSFVVDTKPSPPRLKEAINRQKTRYGFSNLEEQRAKQGKRHGVAKE